MRMKLKKFLFFNIFFFPWVTVVQCLECKEGEHFCICCMCVFAGIASCCAVWTVARVLWQDLPSSPSWASWRMNRMCQ